MSGRVEPALRPLPSTGRVSSIEARLLGLRLRSTSVKFNDVDVVSMRCRIRPRLEAFFPKYFIRR